ncbi:MAG: hypothetical protein WA208_18475 [Thermoanaerobaculia bacterium]
MSFLLKRSFAEVLVVFAFLSTPPAMLGQALTFTTFAGPEGGGGFEDGTGSAARFRSASGVAVDGSGNVYVADTRNHTIRKITPSGAVTTLAGLAGNAGNADGTGSIARFDFPFGLATDSSGNVYVADEFNHTIRKISPAGEVTTLAGLAGAAGSADGIASAARFSLPSGVATDSRGNVYIADRRNNTIRKISPAGEVTTLAGLAGAAGSADGIGSAARFYNPIGVATDSGGNVYVADQVNNTIRKITPTGEVTTLAGFASFIGGAADGAGSAARFSQPWGVATDSGGNVYVGDTFNQKIRKITPDGQVTTLAGSQYYGSADGVGSAARFASPSQVATDSSGNIYVADQGNNKIRKITPAAEVTTLAGLAPSIGSTDDVRSAARFNNPWGVATDSSGNVYVSDMYNHTIRKITPVGVVSTLAGLVGVFGSADGDGSGARFNYPCGVATDISGNIYVADQGNHAVRKITPGGTVTTLAGLAGVSGSADGAGSAARFNVPIGIATDGGANPNVYVADTWNKTIRKISPAGEVTTLAGLAGADGSADGIGSAARFSSPSGVATDSSGYVYVADQASAIRKISPSGEVTTLAGLAGADGSADGVGSAARFHRPNAVATDSGGNVYVTDKANSTIRKISPSGEVTTLAGLVGTHGSEDGPGSAARFRDPSGVATDISGNVFIADSSNNKIRVGKAALADVATIDLTTGPVLATRQLDTSPRRATSWQWTVIRRPVDSTANLSSATVRNPTFTPDAPGLFTFRLTATDASASSVTSVDSTATVLAAPAGFSATAINTTAVSLAWTGVIGATGYEIFRSTGNTEYASLKTVNGSETTDIGLSPDTTYLYKVRALVSGASSAFSTIDVATTILFTDDPLTIGGIIRAAHITQLRKAVNAMRAAKGLGAASYTNSIASGTLIRRIDIADLRSALDEARAAIGLTAVTYTDATITASTTVMKTAHVQDLRDGVK